VELKGGWAFLRVPEQLQKVASSPALGSMGLMAANIACVKRNFPTLMSAQVIPSLAAASKMSIELQMSHHQPI